MASRILLRHTCEWQRVDREVSPPRMHYSNRSKCLRKMWKSRGIAADWLGADWLLISSPVAGEWRAKTAVGAVESRFSLTVSSNKVLSTSPPHSTSHVLASTPSSMSASHTSESGMPRMDLDLVTLSPFQRICSSERRVFPNQIPCARLARKFPARRRGNRK